MILVNESFILYWDRIDLSKEIDPAESTNRKECMVHHCSFFQVVSSPIKPISSWFNNGDWYKQGNEKKEKLCHKTFYVVFTESANFSELWIWQDHIYFHCYSLQKYKTLHLINRLNEPVLHVFFYCITKNAKIADLQMQCKFLSQFLKHQKYIDSIQ